MRRLRPMSALAFVVVSALAASALRAQSPAALDAATIDRWMTELSNWNRWGTDDERGTVNLMTDETRKRALATVKEGVTVSLSRDADPVKSADNGNPLALSMVATADDPDPFAMETLTITFHGSAYTHMDALSHMYYKGRTYNGIAKERVVSKAGAERAGDHRVQARLRRPRRADGHPAPQGRPLPRAADRHHGRRPRRLGEAGRPEGRQRRHRVLPHRPLGAAGQGRRRGTSAPNRRACTRAWRAG